jgi:hypothetical protein
MAARAVLSNAALLRHMMGYPDFGEWLFLAGVCSGWRAAYEAAKSRSIQIRRLSTDLKERHFASTTLCALVSTKYSAVLASASRVKLAQEHNLSFAKNNWKLQRFAGRCADIESLELAHSYGMPHSRHVMAGAAESGSISKLQWLHTEQHCDLRAQITCYAARSGSIEMLNWLHEQQCALTYETSVQAAKAGHLNVLKLLHTMGCPINITAAEAAAEIGAIVILQWLDASDIAWRGSEVYAAAAKSGNMKLMHWMTEHEANFDGKTMVAAAKYGHLEICKYLRSIGCDWDKRAGQRIWMQAHITKWLCDHGDTYNFDNGLSSDSDN